MENLQQVIADLLNNQGLGVLATSAAGHPYTTLVGFTAAEGLREIYFATHRSTRKFANLQKDERVSLLIDNRSNRAEDFRHAAALSATGTAHEIPREDQEKWKKTFLKKHPMLKDFVTAPSCALFCISVQRYSLVQRFQDVVELDVDDLDSLS
ncbi:MAG: pyridoxamine 5'-phosphate oxidase family protein [Desulfuromusa sp.]|jgi:nitroimidazol reductase NimA-like FMN-containing flavoprotein (pyridoxamine 5'-phosphate oxidase superfamily)|nr:pyridoxamine 5'-phosphate oxidase family protein [Desulfuromusa sp.]